jgi:uncharacterized protein
VNKEIRTYNIQEFRAEQEDDKLRFKGYAAVFDSLSENLGGFRERIAKGAFGESVLKDDVRALFNHDANYVIGRNKSGSLRLLEDSKGLYFEAEAPETQWARDLAVSVNRGDINQCSFGFYALEDDWQIEAGEDIRTLKRCQLFDVSIVTYPAYAQTSASIRSIAEARKQEIEKLEEHRRKSDDVLKLKLKLYGGM